VTRLPAAVVFDCDGVLVDSEPHSVEAWLTALEGLGHPARRSHVEACTGLGFGPTWAALDAVAPLPPRETVWPLVLSALAMRFDDPGLERFPDAVGVLEACLGAGVPVAIVSASPRRRLDLTLERSGLAGRVAVTVSGDDVAAAKPAPDAYLLAARALGVDAGSCTAIEDTAAGAASAASAGMRVVAVVRDESHRAALVASGAEVVDELTAQVVGI
jgi:beta-phosphoglucomutase-like phosphatase (HAD superfamily)